jgi:hypothetical protein
MGVFPQFLVDPTPKITRIKFRAKPFLHAPEDVSDVLVDFSLELGRLADRKRPAQIGPIATIDRPPVDDVQLTILDRPVARETAELA